jgi:hypothetical protein
MNQEYESRKFSTMEKISTIAFSLTLAVAIVLRSMINSRNEKKKSSKKY